MIAYVLRHLLLHLLDHFFIRVFLAIKNISQVKDWYKRTVNMDDFVA